ncbi:MAG: DUF3592 domain-containing protein [Candidatus Kariarchaeaceae archaeon]|jgi:hypothetical protein
MSNIPTGETRPNPDFNVPWIAIARIVSLIILCIVAYNYYFNVQTAILAYESNEWEKTSGTVILSEMRTSTDSDGLPSYRPDIRYNYVVEGREYSSSAIYVGGKVGEGLYYTERLLEKYPVGSSLTVFYNPQDHSQSVIEPGLKDPHVEPLFQYFFLFVLALIILAVSKSIFVSKHSPQGLKKTPSLLRRLGVNESPQANEVQTSIYDGINTCERCNTTISSKQKFCSDCAQSLKNQEGHTINPAYQYSSQNANKVPNFFFENIALFFLFLFCLILSLLFLAMSALIPAILFYPPLNEWANPDNPDTDMPNGVKIAFLFSSGLLLIVVLLFYKISKKVWKVLRWDSKNMLYSL